MNQSDLIEVIDLAQRFINVASKQRLAKRSEYHMKNGWAEPGHLAAATKRASMDLTRALAVIRRTAP